MAEIAAFEKIAPYLTHPLVLAGFALFLVFGLYKVLIQSGIIPPVGPRIGGRLVQSILRYGFVLALVVIVLGFALQFLQTPSGKTATEPMHIQGGVGAGGDIKGTQINIQTTPTAATTNQPPTDNGISVQGGVGAGGNIENSRIDISTPNAMPENTNRPANQ